MVLMVVLVVALLVVVIGVFAYLQDRLRRESLRALAERTRRARNERVETLHLQPLSAKAATRYAHHWRETQAEFVDDPLQAISDADVLLADVMRARGYPIGHVQQRAAEVIVDHAGVVEHYRAAHAI